jgi:hypothetical protein
MTETPLSEQDQADLDLLGETETQDRSLLAIWSELLEPVDEVRAQPIPVQVAAKVVASWTQMTFQDTAIYHLHYHDLIIELRTILRGIIAENPECTSFVGDDDAAENHELYRDVLVAWHRALDEHERNWRAEDPTSHIDAAVIADARAFFFAQTGLAGHLDAIGFALTNDEFIDALRAAEEVQGE